MVIGLAPYCYMQEQDIQILLEELKSSLFPTIKPLLFFLTSVMKRLN